MYCLKCGNETLEEKIFCEECLQVAQIYPVKPGTPIQLPRQDTVKKTSAQKRTISAEEQVESLKKTVRRMGFLLFLMTVALGISLATIFNLV